MWPTPRQFLPAQKPAGPDRGHTRGGLDAHPILDGRRRRCGRDHLHPLPGDPTPHRSVGLVGSFREPGLDPGSAIAPGDGAGWGHGAVAALRASAELAGGKTSLPSDSRLSPRARRRTGHLQTLMRRPTPPRLQTPRRRYAVSDRRDLQICVTGATGADAKARSPITLTQTPLRRPWSGMSSAADFVPRVHCARRAFALGGREQKRTHPYTIDTREESYAVQPGWPVSTCHRP